jgi:hypothetical protein
MVNVWFLMPSSIDPSGGINNVYRLCELGEELGIHCRVVSDSPYQFCDPPQLSRFWVSSNLVGFEDRFNISQIQSGDIVVTTDIMSRMFNFNVPVRRVTYLQSWALTFNITFENHFWIYNNPVHLGHNLHTLGVSYDKFKPDFSTIWPYTEEAFNRPKIKFSHISPYFKFEDFTYTEPNDKILFLPRRMPEIKERIISEFGDRVVQVDGVSPEELRIIYREVGIVFLPSPAESLSFPVVEGLLSGCVPVIWECGGPEYFVINEETGMVSSHGDLESMIQNTKFLIDNPEKRSQMAKRGCDLVKNLWTRERSKMEFYLTYKSTLRDIPTKL